MSGSAAASSGVMRGSVAYFAQSLASFQGSQDIFRVLRTLRHGASSGTAASRSEAEPAPESESAPRPPGRPVRRVVVLDSSFNPPTRAHAGMARAALRATREQDGGQDGGGGRLLLLLSVNNADKAPKPASFPVRLAMMEAFGRELLEDVRREDAAASAAPTATATATATTTVDVGVTTMAFFHDKARAIVQSGFYGAGAEPAAATTTTTTELVFLAGYDTLVRIFKPKYYGAGTAAALREALTPMFAATRLRVTTRPEDAGSAAAGSGFGSASGSGSAFEEQRAFVARLAAGELGEAGAEAAWAERIDVVDGDAEGETVSSSRVREAVRAGRMEELDGLVGAGVREWIQRESLYRD